MKEKKDGNCEDQYVSGSVVRATFGVAPSTLRAWAEEGKVSVVRFGKNGKRLYKSSEVEALFRGYVPKSEATREAAAASGARARICYARVSSGKQRDDLERQVAALREAYPDHEVVTDVASGINWKRTGLLSVLDRAIGGGVQEVVVSHRDRLCRFAFELIEHVLSKCGCRVVVVQSAGDAQTDESELRDDLLAIVTCFVASNNGKRAAAHRRAKRARDEAAQEATQGSEAVAADQVQEAADPPDAAAGGEAEAVA
jgi:predicted site-specific integrase-resolvase